MIKVLIVHSTNNIISGAEYAIIDMLHNIPNDFQIEMQTPGKGRLTDFLRGKGFVVHTHKFSNPRRRYPGLFWLSSFFYAIWLKINNYDIIICNTFAASFRVSLSAKLSGKKLIIYTREYFSKHKQSNITQIKRADAIFAVSNDVNNYYGSMHNNIIICHDTINISAIRSRIAKHKSHLLNNSFFNIGFVGRLTKYKQPDLLIYAILKVKKKIPNAKFHIVGSATSSEMKYLASLHSLVEELQLSQHVEFWGHRDDSIEILKELDLFCLTSEREPFPRTILESMLCYTPVICSNTGGCLEMVKDCETGLFFDILSEERISNLANKIIQIYEDTKLSNYIKTKAYHNVNETFSENKQVKHFFESLKSVINK